MNGYKEINYLPLTPSLAKVGVGGSNPLARSRFFNRIDLPGPRLPRGAASIWQAEDGGSRQVVTPFSGAAFSLVIIRTKGAMLAALQGHRR
jgi:hypothetical protein